jgi:nucleoside-diphosphate-sugar epimerase
VISGLTLIAGGSGFIGGRLLMQLRAEGIPFRCLSRRGASGDGSIALDLCNTAGLERVCAGVDTVFHCAGYAHAFLSSDSGAHWRINFEGTRNLVNAAGRAGASRFIFLSSVKAMAEPGTECVDEDWPGEPATPYGKAKRAAEDAVLEAGSQYGMHVVNLRLAMVYGRNGRGNLERMARSVRAGWFPPLPETGNRRSLVHVDDVVSAMRLVATVQAANQRTYIVADPRAYSGREIFDAIRLAVGKSPLHWGWPEGVLRAAGTTGDIFGRWLHRVLPVNSELISRLLDSACYSPARIERETGWHARYDLAAGLREMLA